MWQWMVNEGLIEGDPGWYSSGKGKPGDYAHAISTAYKATAPDSPERKKLVDYLWATGQYEGNPDYWYGDKVGEVGDLANASQGLATTANDTPTTVGEVDIDATPTGDFNEGSSGARFNVIGGDPHIWHNTDDGKVYVVYFVPDTEPPVPVTWHVPDEQVLQAYFGPDVEITYDLNVTTEQLKAYGALPQGMSTEIENTDEDPLSGWASIYERQAEVRPYLRDPEVVALIMGAAIEGRTITQAEFDSTAWAQGRTEGERAWAILVEADPLTATQRLQSNYERVRADLMAAGSDSPPDEMVEFLANRFTTGVWTENQMAGQISALTDSYSNFDVYEETQTFLDSGSFAFDQTRGEEDTARRLLETWLGPVSGAWDTQSINDLAGRLRNNPDAEIEIVEELKDGRSMFLDAGDARLDTNLTYQQIAAPWKNYWFQQWGEQADETDDLFSQVLRTNNTTEAGKMMTNEGISRGVGKVVNDIGAQLSNEFGAVRGAT